MTVPAVASEQTRRALLIGIDEYKHFTPLNGCRNDVERMEQVLRSNFGFQHVTTLLNGDATRDGILAAFQQLLADTQENDVVVIHYAGHGSTIADAEGDEPSGFDSTLQPVDTWAASARRNRISTSPTTRFISFFSTSAGRHSSSR